ncbi:1126_t:CDS:1, partial [Acaulospora colombiana]
QVINFIRKNIQEHRSLQKACEDLMDRCLAKDSELGGIGCDNMTVIIVAFLNGKSVKEWYTWMESRYGKEYQDMNDMNDDLEGDMEIPSEDSYDDNDHENQINLTIDDVHRLSSDQNNNETPSGVPNSLDNPRSLPSDPNIPPRGFDKFHREGRRALSEDK